LNRRAASRESRRGERETHQRKKITPRSFRRLSGSGRQSAGKLAGKTRALVKLFHALPVIGELGLADLHKPVFRALAGGAISVRLS
jgi:hypothetical protein